MPHNQPMSYVVKEVLNPDACRASFEGWIRQILDHCSEPIVKLGNVHFWIDKDGPWADQMSFGMAVFRANICKSPRNKEALSLPRDKEHVFSWPNEFIKHHRIGVK